MTDKTPANQIIENQSEWTYLEEALSVLNRGHLSILTEGEVVKPDLGPLKEYITDHLRLIQVTKVVYEKKNEKIEELMNILGAMYDTNCTLFNLIVGENNCITFISGVVQTEGEIEILDTGRKVLESCIQGHFTGTKTDLIKKSENAEKYLNCEIWKNSNAIAALTGIPSMKTAEGQEFIQGIDRYLDAMRGKEFVSIMIADPVSNANIAKARAGYCELSTALSGICEHQINIQENVSKQVTEGTQRTVTNSISKTVGLTQTTTTTETKGTSRLSIGGVAAGVGLAAAAIGAVALTVGTAGAAAPALAAAAPLLMTGAGGAGLGLGMGIGGQKQKSTSTSKSDAVNESETQQTSLADGETYSLGITEGITHGKTITIKNRLAKYISDKLDKNIERIDRGSQYGFWNTGIYFISETEQDAVTALSIMGGLFRGENSELEPYRTCMWVKDKNKENYENVKCAIQHLRHPMIRANSILSDATYKSMGVDTFLPTTLLSSDELAIVMGYPEKSLPGLTVLKSTAFGRQVSRQTAQASNVKDYEHPKINIGNIYHMGVEEKVPVTLDIPSLSSHVFITGTTGCGKTETTLSILKCLYDRENPIPFLVIEPVKGEYRRLISMRSNINNSSITYLTAGLPGTKVLRVNPFQFNDDIHVFEHIDRLVQVFNASFPMYASMPALLEDAIRSSYEVCGWNLSTSKCRYTPKRFPSLINLVNQLGAVIKSAGYSEQLTSDFKGALETRIKSLTRGIRGEMLCPLPGQITSEEEIFDKNCVINLSSIGSPDTRSLIMGILLIKLYEYRQRTSDSKSKEPFIERMNHNRIGHITVIEEAHSILKRHSTEVSQESANLQGMAVEMFSNAIAEMRAMGEGFLIVDQSSTSLDLSVIKNTNTKIVMRTPFEDDRKLVGKSMNASDDQIDELGHLETGVCAVYQNDWLEPVLCKVAMSGLNDQNVYEKDFEVKPALSRSQILTIIALPTITNIENPKAIASGLLKEINGNLETALKEISNVLGNSDVIHPALEMIYGDSPEEGYKILQNLFFTKTDIKNQPKNAVLGYLINLFSEPLKPIHSIVAEYKPSSDEWLELVKSYFL